MRKLQGHRAGSLVFFLFSFSFIYSQNGILKGIVKDDDNLLQAATVSINNKTLLSNINGEFLIPLAPGSYPIVITYAGYKKLEQEIKIEKGITRVLYFKLIRDESLGQVVVLGSLSSIYRSNMNTPFPVDAVATRDLVKNQVELTQMLSSTVPSYSSPPQVLAGGAHSMPFALGGLSPDQTLVLLNGKRLHTSSYIYKVLSIGTGNVGTDINSIPQPAIEKVEILRNGASAQYGSDAIAGVVNVQLKQTTGKTFIDLHTGQYYDGDGETISLGINHGITINKKGMATGSQGFLSVSAVMDYKADAWRSEGFYTGTVYYNIPRSASQQQIDNLIALDNAKIKETGFDRKKHWRAGIPQVKNAGFLVNGGYPVGSNTRSFWTISFNGRETKVDAGNYRYPKDTQFVITELYPDGFRAVSIQNTWDVAAIAGIEGSTSKGWNWNASATYGANWWKVNLNNSNNASQYYQFGKNAQTDFYLGTTVFQQNTNNINFNRDLTKRVRGVKLFALSAGTEFRMENYQMRAGDSASWYNYAPTFRRVGGSQTLTGISPENVVNKNRFVLAAYANLEVEPNNKFLYNLSGRYECYNDFGGNLAGNLAVRYKLSDRFTLRGSISNGFRAPGLPQRYYSEVTQRNNRIAASQSYKLYTFRNDSKIANDFGVPSLTAEKSLHFSSGITAKLLRHVKLIADYYRIQIRDRIVLSGFFDRDSNVVVDQILTANGYDEISQVAFFANAISTITEGLDVALKGKWKIKKSVLEILLSGNFNQTKLYGDIKKAGKLPDDSVNASQLFNRLERGKIERAHPRSKIIFLVSYNCPRWKFTINNIRYGKVVRMDPSDPSLDERLSPKITTDISASYKFKKSITITAGARNVFDVYPDRIKNQSNTGSGTMVYFNNFTQFGYMGGYYFMNMNFSF